jgi:lipopolysaccharide/colanic/teichoic acid biosynthesis glycosyltransferase
MIPKVTELFFQTVIVTAFGKFMQNPHRRILFLNVLKGDMAVVGPRPNVLFEKKFQK